ncbi:unnamed protein product [Rotaria sp. Silwood1]|nr:unnamed protein product [Rotaria sp. Silwood1]CAF1667890.1 unnamed protein product [Rotaria sp. Silwood1]
MLPWKDHVQQKGEGIRDEKVKVLRSVVPIKTEDVIIGQYFGVPKDSTTPIYAQVILSIHNERWAGIPFILGAADVLPELIIKLIAPFFMHKISYNIRFVFIVLFAASALIIVGTSKVIALSLFGVVCASISAGVGEVTMLQLTSFYAKHTVSAWSSGTGAAGLFGALSYTGLTSLLKLSPRTAILILLFIPVLLVVSYIMVGASQAVARHRQYQQMSEQTTTDVDTDSNADEKIIHVNATLKDFRSRIKLVKPLLKYMIPLTIVYFAEYLINQGLLTNMGIFFACVYRTAYIPSIWLVFGLVIFEGLIGGGAYVNTFYKISIEIPKPDREFSMGVASIGDSFGITFAGLSAIPLHNAICR